jgi:hypothetical protein
MTTLPKPKAETAANPGRKRRVLGSPLLHFVILGGLLFFAERTLVDPGPEVVIRLTAQQIAALETGWRERNGRAPDAELLKALVDSHIRDELLLHEARALGWHLTDGIVQRRLLRNQRFLEADESVPDQVLLERAFEQQMDKTDLVVRRRLLERMRLRIAARVRATPPSEAELEDFLAQNADYFRRPERVDLSHVFLSRDSRGEGLRADAEALGQRLREENISPHRAKELGDPFLLAHRIPLSSEASIGRQYGPGFAAGAIRAPLGEWSGPIPSSYGAHLVWVHERSPSRVPDLHEIRPRVESELLREREQAELLAHSQRLRENAEIIVPGEQGAPAP